MKRWHPENRNDVRKVVGLTRSSEAWESHLLAWAAFVSWGDLKVHQIGQVEG